MIRLALISFLLVALHATAQICPSRFDSLKKEITIAKDANSKARSLNELASLYLEAHDYPAAKGILNQAKQENKKSPNQTTKALLMIAEARILDHEDASNASADSIQKAVNILRSEDDELALGRALLALGHVYSSKGSFMLAIEQLYAAKAIFEKHDDHYLIAKSLLELSIVFHHRFDYEKSGEVLTQLFNLNLSSSGCLHKHALATAYNGYGVLLYNQKKFEEAETFYNKALSSFEELECTFHQLLCLINLGSIHGQQGHSEKMEKYYLQAMAIAQRIGADKQMVTIYSSLGVLAYREKDDRETAEQYLFKAINLAKELKNSYRLSICYNSMYRYYDYYNETAPAFNFYRKHVSLRDSVSNKKIEKQIAHLEMSYEISAKDRQIELLEFETERTEKQKMLAILIAVFVLIIGVVMFVIFRQKNTLITLRNQQLEIDMELKNREMVAKMMNLAEKNNLIQGLVEKLRTLQKNSKVENQKLIQQLMIELKMSQDQKLWVEFELHFTDVHPKYYKAIEEVHGSLTPNEKKLCAFLKLNLSTKDISAITYQSVNSIEMARGRLRQKFGITNTDTSLTAFLSAI